MRDEAGSAGPGSAAPGSEAPGSEAPGSEAPGSTWAGTHHYGARALRRPIDTAELQGIVAGADRVRALGSRHSFNDLADTAGELVTLVGLDPAPVLDADARTVTVGSGISFGVLGTWLEARGFALHNLGSLPHISVGGATATGTHGSGDGNGSLSTAVAGLELVDGRGELVSIRRGDPGFDGLVVGLGAFGVVTRVTLDVQPSYRMRQDVYLDLPWESALGRFDEIMSAAYSVSLFLDWTGDTLKQVWVKTRLDDAAEGDEADGVADADGAAGAVGRADFFGARPAGDKVMSPAGDDIDNTTVQGGVEGPWLERLPHFRLDSTPSNGDEIQTEYFVDRTDAVAALSALRELRDRIAPHLLVSEVRSVAGDALWLSPTRGRDSVALHFTWLNHPEAVRELLPLVEAALAPFDPRPHWGKWFALTAEQIAPKYERLAEFEALSDRFDPDHTFRNTYLERVLGLPK